MTLRTLPERGLLVRTSAFFVNMAAGAAQTLWNKLAVSGRLYAVCCPPDDPIAIRGRRVLRQKRAERSRDPVHSIARSELVPVADPVAL